MLSHHDGYGQPRLSRLRDRHAHRRIVKTHGRLSAEQAHDYKRELVAAKRDLRDVY